MLHNVALALLVVGIENQLIFSGIGFSGTGTKGGALLGPIHGSIIGAVWMALFGSLGVSRGIMEADGSVAARRAAGAVLTLLFACAAYPFYTIGLNNETIGLIGNIITIALSVWTGVQLASVRRSAVIAPLAVIAWVAFATVALIDEGHF